MKNITDLTLSPEQLIIEKRLYQAVAEHFRVSADEIAHIQVLRRSIDSRRAPAKYHVTADVYFKGEEFAPTSYHSDYQYVANATPVIIVGAGPAGLFAALRALELGVKPIIIEQFSTTSIRMLYQMSPFV